MREKSFLSCLEYVYQHVKPKKFFYNSIFIHAWEGRQGYQLSLLFCLWMLCPSFLVASHTARSLLKFLPCTFKLVECSGCALSSLRTFENICHMHSRPSLISSPFHTHGPLLVMGLDTHIHSRHQLLIVNFWFFGFFFRGYSALPLFSAY